jgi:hypothetical protein
MSAVGQSNPFSDASEFNMLSFVIARAIEDMQTVSIVQVKAVNTAAQTVDAQVLVNIITGAGTSVPHGVISARPYFRLQGGGNAIIIDPVVNDIGIMVFGSRDLTAVIAAKAAANPGSQRKYAWSDGLYFGGILNGTPTQYIKIDSSGVTIVSPTAVTIQAPTITLDGDVHITGATVGDGEGTFDGTVVHTHTHSGVQSGGSNTGPPT